MGNVTSRKPDTTTKTGKVTVHTYKNDDDSITVTKGKKGGEGKGKPGGRYGGKENVK